MLITKTDDGAYRVSDVDVDGSGGFFIRQEPFLTLEEAIKAANEYQLENEVEYGLKIEI